MFMNESGDLIERPNNFFHFILKYALELSCEIMRKRSSQMKYVISLLLYSISKVFIGFIIFSMKLRHHLKSYSDIIGISWKDIEAHKEFHKFIYYSVIQSIQFGIQDKLSQKPDTIFILYCHAWICMKRPLSSSSI